LRRICLIVFSCLLLVGGCSDDKIKNKPIYQQTAELENLINQEHWDEASNKIKEVQQIFETNKWKYQFLGDEREYGGLDEEISKLEVAIEEKNKIEAKQSIVLIELYLHSLYFK
jgi:hypothetical protein